MTQTVDEPVVRYSNTTTHVLLLRDLNCSKRSNVLLYIHRQFMPSLYKLSPRVRDLEFRNPGEFCLWKP